MHFYLSEVITHVSLVKGADVGFTNMEGLTPVTSLNENGASLDLSNKSKKLKRRYPVVILVMLPDSNSAS